jgi:hypothetical protein
MGAIGTSRTFLQHHLLIDRKPIMSNDQVIRKILGGAGEALDDIAIYTPKISRPVTRVGLRISLKFRDGHTLEKRRAFVAVLRAYFDEFAEHMTHWLPNSGNQLRRIVDRQFPPLVEEVSALPENEDFGVQLVGYRTAKFRLRSRLDDGAAPIIPERTTFAKRSAHGVAPSQFPNDGLAENGEPVDRPSRAFSANSLLRR